MVSFAWYGDGFRSRGYGDCAVFAKVFCSSYSGLARRFDQAADYVAQRLKAVEYTAVRGGKWEHAQFMELITPENRGSISTPADLNTIVTERRSKKKLAPDNDYENYWKGHGPGILRPDVFVMRTDGRIRP